MRRPLALFAATLLGCTDPTAEAAAEVEAGTATACAIFEPSPGADDERPTRCRAAEVDPSRRTIVPEPPRNSDGSPQALPPGPPSRPPHTLVLAYHEFGPQALAGELLGPEWWQWAPGGSWEPGDRFDVRVVVYRGISAREVEAAYPSAKDHADYRYVPHAAAIEHLERGIAACEGSPELESLRASLVATRARVREALGE